MASETHSNPTVILISAPKVAGSIIGNDLIREANVSDEDELDVVINATCRVSVGDSGGSGTIVGHSSDGRSLILTNAHVVGTQKGRVTKVERWDQNGNRYLGSARIIAAGYGKELGVDFALIQAVGDFGKGVTPVPLVDRPPAGRVTNYGSPNFEWPSMQTLKMVKAEGQLLAWYPEAISGRSGSSLVDYSDAGPRVVGLLTWSGQGKGLGQSSSFVIDAIRGRLPKSFEPLPPGITEVGCTTDVVEDITAPPEPRQPTGPGKTHPAVELMLTKLDTLSAQQTEADKCLMETRDDQQQVKQLLVDQSDSVNKQIEALQDTQKHLIGVIESSVDGIDQLKKAANECSTAVGVNSEAVGASTRQDRYLISLIVVGAVVFLAIKIGRGVAWLFWNFEIQRTPTTSTRPAPPIN